MTDTKLLEEFVATFEKLDDMSLFDHMVRGIELPAEMDGGQDGSYGFHRWKVGKIHTDRIALAEFYERVPGPLPPLYEQLVLSYRWLGVSLGEIVALRANAPALSLAPLIREITADPAFVAVLFPLGLVPFGKRWEGNYDPICFDLSRRQKDGDCPVVRLEHESILCDSRIGESSEVAPSFRALVYDVIGQCNQKESH